MITTRLYDVTYIALKGRDTKLTLDKISKETGLEYSWLQMFSRGRIKDPSVNKIETLYEYLSGSKIELP